MRGHNKIPPGPAYVVDKNDCWIWQRSKSAGGYGKITKNGRTVNAHVWIYGDSVPGGIPEGMEVHHVCEVPLCVNPAHMALLSHAEHRRHHGARSGPERRSGPGRKGARGLTWPKVRAIRSLRDEYTNGELAAMFGVQKPAIVRILRNYRWHDPDYVP